MALRNGWPWKPREGVRKVGSPFWGSSRAVLFGLRVRQGLREIVECGVGFEATGKKRKEEVEIEKSLVPDKIAEC